MCSHKNRLNVKKIKEILIMPPYLALLSTLNGSNYPCLELIFMVPKVFEPLKFDCNYGLSPRKLLRVMRIAAGWKGVDLIGPL